MEKDNIELDVLVIIPHFLILILTMSAHGRVDSKPKKACNEGVVCEIEDNSKER